MKIDHRVKFGVEIKENETSTFNKLIHTEWNQGLLLAKGFN